MSFKIDFGKELFIASNKATAVGLEFYIPHQAIVRKSAESTKLRLVYDSSARSHDQVSIFKRLFTHYISLAPLPFFC